MSVHGPTCCTCLQVVVYSPNQNNVPDPADPSLQKSSEIEQYTIENGKVPECMCLFVEGWTIILPDNQMMLNLRAQAQPVI